MPNHRCDERTIDYSTVDLRWIQCQVCGRMWELGVHGWTMIPREAAPPRTPIT